MLSRKTRFKSILAKSTELSYNKFMVRTGKVMRLMSIVYILAVVASVACVTSAQNHTSFATGDVSMAATIQPSMALVVSDDSKTLSLSPSSNGVFNSTSITVGAYSNGSIGYSLIMTMPDAALTGAGTGTTIPTLTSDSACTGGSTCTNNDFELGHWGIAVGSEVYKAASTRSLATVENTNTGSITNDNTYTINLGANIDLSVPTDIYSTTINFALTSSSVAAYDVTFSYDSHFADFTLEEADGTDLTPIATDTNSKTYTLDYASTYNIITSFVGRYRFDTADVSGPGFMNADTLAFTVGGTSTVSLISSRIPCNPAGTTIGTIVCMQDINDTNRASIVGSMAPSTNYTLYDDRDDEAYTIALLLDNKVWMTKNLNLAGGTAMSADDTDIDSEYIASFTTGNGLTKVGNTIVLPASATITSGTSLDSSQFSANEVAYVFNSGSTVCVSNLPCYSYYSNAAATVGYGPADAFSNVPYSICPKGWRLPMSGVSANGDFSVLATAYGANLDGNLRDNSGAFFQNAGPGTIPGFVRAGNYHAGKLNSSGLSGYYYSATNTQYSAAYLVFGQSSLYSGTTSNRYFGDSIRCLLRS